MANMYEPALGIGIIYGNSSYGSTEEQKEGFASDTNQRAPGTWYNIAMMDCKPAGEAFEASKC